MKKNILIVGGSSGVGASLAAHYCAEGHNVCITGRKDRGNHDARFLHLDITASTSELKVQIDQIVDQFPDINTLVYCAGFVQRGSIDALSDDDLQSMTNIGLLAPMMLVRRLKVLVEPPLKVMLVTSSSQFVPRELEPAYCAVKSGLGMFGASIARDQGIGKVLVIAPAGMDTHFWQGTGEDTSTMLNADWAASQIVDLSGGAFKYKLARLHRNPPRVEVLECLDDEMNTV